MTPFDGPHTIGSSRSFWAGAALLAAVFLLFPLVGSRYDVLQMSGIFIWLILALSLVFVWGYGGIFSFGQTAFFGIGGYTFGIVGINLLEATGATTVALVTAIVVPSVFAGILGYFMFYGRVRGVYVALITLAFSLILGLILSRTSGPQYRIGEAHLGGYNGMTRIPTMRLGVDPIVLELTPLLMYYAVVVLVAALFIGLRYLVNSDFGYVMVAIREDEIRTETFGYDVRRFELLIFVIGAGIAGLGGAFYASQGNFISPPIMGLVSAALPVIWVTVGGRSTLIGGLIGAYLLQYLNQSLAGLGSQYAVIVLGLILIFVILFFPDGLVPTVADRIDERNGGR